MTIAEIEPPNTAGWTVLRDPNPNQVWNTSTQMQAGVDYVLMPPVGVDTWTRTRRINVGVGGRHVYIPDLEINIGVAGGPMLDIRVGSSARDVFCENIRLRNPDLLETDGFRCTNGAGGNISTGSGGTTLKILNTRVEDLVGSSAGVHADGIQLSGGIRALHVQDSTFKSGYVPLQLQREQAVTGNARNITALTRSGTTATVTVDGTGLAISVGDWVEVVGTSPTTWRSTYPVRSIITGTAGVSVTKFTYFLGDGGQSSWTGGGTATKSKFNYYVGNVTLLRVNCRRFDNLTPDPPETLTGIRINAGRPDSKSSNAEDRTPLLVEGMPGTLEMEDFYIEPNPGETLADMVEPGTTSSVYSVARASYDTSGDPNTLSWPSHPNITGFVYEGVPSTGDFASDATTLTIADARHTHSADNVVLTQVHSLVVADASHAHTADNVVLAAGGDSTLVIQKASHATSSDNVVLTQEHNLTIQDGSHATSADNVELTQMGTGPGRSGKPKNPHPHSNIGARPLTSMPE